MTGVQNTKVVVRDCCFGAGLGSVQYTVAFQPPQILRMFRTDLQVRGNIKYAIEFLNKKIRLKKPIDQYGHYVL